MNRLRMILPLALVAAVAACGAPRRYVNPSADLSTVKTVAVLPFENVTNDKLCAVRVEKLFVTELLNVGAFQVLEPGQVARALRRDSVEVGALTPEDVKRLGEALKAQALFLGAVLEYEEGRGSAQGPRVRLQLKMVETQTGATVWSSSPTRGGVSVGTRLFGLEGRPASELAQDAIRDELAQLTR